MHARPTALEVLDLCLIARPMASTPMARPRQHRALTPLRHHPMQALQLLMHNMWIQHLPTKASQSKPYLQNIA
ncbi:hypothetical protein X975_04377, partial [Stegodyphus mimosarum]